MTWPSGDPNQPQGGHPPPPQGGWPPPPPPPPQPGPWPPPPPQPYSTPQYGQDTGYAYPAPKKSKKGLIIGLSILGVVVLLGIGALVIGAYALKDTTIATDMKLGDCITDIPTDAKVMTLPTVDCKELHGGEVYAVITMPDGDYPGQAKIDEYQQKCPEELVTFSPEANEDEGVGIYVLYPTPETWGRGDRAVTCIATLDPKRSGPLKG